MTRSRRLALAGPIAALALALLLVVPAPAAGQPARKPASPGRLAEVLDRLRDLSPADRLKLVEKLAEADSPYSAVVRGDLVATLIERGSIEPASYTDLVCRVKPPGSGTTAATTIKWLIDDGARVKKGDRLAELDDSAVRERLEVASVRAREAEAALVQATEDVRLARRELEVVTRLGEIEIRLAEIELKDAPTEKARLVLQLKAERAKLELERAASRAKARLAQAEAVSQARSAARELAARRLQDLEADLQQCVLVAPSDGFVVYPTATAGRFGAAPVVAPGEPVREGQVLLRLTDLKQLVLALRVHEALVSAVRAGQAARVRVDAYPAAVLRGAVKHVSPVASASDWRAADVKVYPVTVAIENAPPGLKPGMSGEAQIATGERKAVLQVPLRAVLNTGKARVCLVKVGQELQERAVATGAAGATSVEIRSGLKEGEQVVTDPAALLLRQ